MFVKALFCFVIIQLFPFMSERERSQRGLKRRKKSCVSSMMSTVILKVCFPFCSRIFSVCCMLQDTAALCIEILVT